MCSSFGTFRVQMPNSWQVGKGPSPEKGDRVVVEWTGYTIGYFGRPFETKQLRSLDGLDDEYLRFEVDCWQLKFAN